AARRYSVTTSDPGARLGFTHGFVFRPRRTALRASSPAAIITLGFDVFVQLVIAAMTTDPWSSPSRPGTADSSVATADADVATLPAVAVSAGAVNSPGFSFAGLSFRSASITSSACWNLIFVWLSDTRSCGRLGPARLGSTVERSSSALCVYIGSDVPALLKRA